MDYEKFLSPGKIGSLEMKNRCIFPPMGSMCAERDGTVGDRMIRYHVRRVEGGCAMNIVEVAAVHRTSFQRPNIGIHDDAFIPGLTRLAGAIQEAGGKACIQLWHGGRQVRRKRLNEQPWAPSAIACPYIGERPHEMTTAEIEDVVAAYAEAAVRAKKAGFDAVEIHGAHGYLIDCFLNAYSNTRTDAYGGCFENRLRFALEVIAAVRAKVGPDYPVMFRMNAVEQTEGGIALEESIDAAKRFQAAGVDALDISQGCYGAMASIVPPYFLPTKTNARNASKIKEHTTIPIIVAGRIVSPDDAEEILQNGWADFISLGRAQLADPDFVKKTMEGRENEIVRCVSCNEGCINSVFKGKSISCVFNPASGRENEIIVRPAEKKKKVLVIGGGPGGLEAARVARERGHEVVLLEKSGKLGGQFFLAGFAPHKSRFTDAAIHMGYRAQRAGADIRLYSPATPQKIKTIDPDVVIVAVGSEPLLPPIPGVKGPNVYEARSVISGKTQVTAHSIAVIGGGLVGLEVMEMLAGQGKEVTVVEMADQVGKDIGLFNQSHIFGIIAEKKIPVHVNTKCVEIGPDYLLLDKGGEKIRLDCDAAVIATGAKSDARVAAMVRELGFECHVIGDADKPAKALEAIWAGNEIARKI